MYRSLRLFLFGLFQLSLVTFGSSETNADIGDSCNDASGKQGICQNLQLCPSAMERLRENVEPKICSFDGRDPIVCCVKEDEKNSSAAVIASEMKPGDKAQYWCNKYTNICPDSLVGSDLANSNEFPHVAAVGHGAKEKILWSCAGTLVSEKFVLTVAHCLETRSLGPATWVLLGTEVIRSATEEASPNAKRGQIHPVIRRIRHPGYKIPAVYNDIGLLEIGPALEANPLPLDSLAIHPACLPIKRADYPPVVIVTGWGRVGFSEETRSDLYKVKIDILDSALCNDSYSVEIRRNKLPRGIDGTMICTVGLEDDKDVCQGGAPLQVPVKGMCMYEILGISSFGRLCGHASSPSVYTRVSEYIPWIESIVWP